jgi:hypothetical protein
MRLWQAIQRSAGRWKNGTKRQSYAVLAGPSYLLKSIWRAMPTVLNAYLVLIQDVEIIGISILKCFKNIRVKV